jgi:hypothetical protein
MVRAASGLLLTIAQTGIHGIPVMPRMLGVNLMLGASTMVAARSYDLHACQTPARARKNEREHGEQNHKGAGAAVHVSEMI